jgi:hypothetical protein
LLRSMTLPSVVRDPGFDPSAFGFAQWLRGENPQGLWDSAGLWAEYADFIATCAPLRDYKRHLSRSQFFRTLGVAGICRFRCGSKNAEGRRPYLYRLTSPKRPGRRPGRIVDARPWSVGV